MQLLKEWIDSEIEWKQLRENPLEMVNQAILGEIKISGRIKILTLERQGLTKILGPHFKKIMLKPQLLMNQQKTLKLI